MSSFIYNAAKRSLLKGEIDLETDSLKVALVGSGYIADIDDHVFFDDLTHEVSGTGYTVGGKTLQNKSLTIDDGNDLVRFEADSLSWTVATLTTRAAVIYKDTGSAATSPLLAYIDFEEELEAAGEDFLLQWHEDGILALAD